MSVRVPLTIALLGIVSQLPAGDWPQILGPDRNGIARDEKLMTTFPAEGPRTVWQRDVGQGFAGIAVSQGKAVLFHRVGDQETAEALDALTGEVLWTNNFPAEYVPSFTDDAGPRAVPLIYGGNAYLYGARGILACVKMIDGTTVWKRDLYQDYSSKRPSRGEPPEGYFGFGATPIVERDKLILNVGGDVTDAGIVAFDLQSGETLWKATKERASYSSPVAATINGQRHVIFATRLNVVSVDPDNGTVQFRFPFGRLGPAVTAANPVVIENHVLISASYGFGAVWAKVGRSGATQEWNSDDLISSQYTTCIRVGNLLYGIHGRQDVGEATLRCIDPQTKTIKSSHEGFGYATLILADKLLLAMKTDGELVAGRPVDGEFQEIGRARLFRATTRALPALANGLLYVRDSSTLKCVDLRAAN